MTADRSAAGPPQGARPPGEAAHSAARGEHTGVLTFGLVAPSGYVADVAAIDRIRAYFERRGSRLVVDPTCTGRWTRFSASDDERVAALHRMAMDPDVDVVLAARGGYGLSRLLDRIDYPLLAHSRKLFAGHSDFTALNLALLARAGAVSLAGPAGVFDFGGESVDPFTEAHFWSILDDPRHEVVVPGGDRRAVAGTWQGTIWGGNLALVSHLVGTRYLPSVDRGILFLEDVNEHPYRVERMLLQLLHAGVLDAQSLILLGDFSGYQLGSYDNGYDLAQVVEFLRSRTRTPVLGGLPFGHVRAKITIPVGADARVESRRDAWTLTVSGYPTLPRAFRVREADWNIDRPQLAHVRRTVFVDEQQVPEALEWDELDARSRHVIATDATGAAIGTGRLLPDGHIGRLAVLRPWRTQGVGAALLAHLIALARDRGEREVVLNAQVQAMGFYERFGFAPRGEPFSEADIPHREMFLRLDA